MPPPQSHTYEEIRDVVVDILLGRERTQYDPSQFEHLKLGVNEVFGRRAGQTGHASQLPRNPRDEELVRDVFWDLFRQGAITLGMNNSNPNWPFFRLSHLGERTLASQSPWRFHDTSSYLTLVRREVPDLSDQAAVYLDEAVQAFLRAVSLGIVCHARCCCGGRVSEAVGRRRKPTECRQKLSVGGKRKVHPSEDYEVLAGPNGDCAATGPAGN